MKKLLFIILSIALFSCSNSDECGCTSISRNLDIAIKDKDGNNLLNTSGYNFSTIQIKYSMPNSSNLVNGESPIFIDEGQPRIRVFLNSNKKEDFPTTYLIWSNNDIDTIHALYNRDNNATILNKIWYNGNLIQEFIQPEYYINVVK